MQVESEMVVRTEKHKQCKECAGLGSISDGGTGLAECKRCVGTGIESCEDPTCCYDPAEASLRLTKIALGCIDCDLRFEWPAVLGLVSSRPRSCPACVKLYAPAVRTASRLARLTQAHHELAGLPEPMVVPLAILMTSVTYRCIYTLVHCGAVALANATEKEPAEGEWLLGGVLERMPMHEKARLFGGLKLDEVVNRIVHKDNAARRRG